MSTLIIVLTTAIAVAALIGLAKWQYNRYIKRQTATLTARLDALKVFAKKAKVIGSPEREMLGLVKFRYYDEALEGLGFPGLGRYEEAHVLIAQLKSLADDDKNFNRLIETFRSRHEAFLSATPDENLIQLGSALLSTFRDFDSSNKPRVASETGFNLVATTAKMRGYFEETVRSLLERADTDYAIFLELKDFIRMNRSNAGGSYPDNWHELVSRHIPTPSLYDFGIESNSLSRYGRGDADSTLRAMAAEALRDSDYAQAKLVLAYVDSYNKDYRAAVGPILIADIAKMIAKLDSETKCAAPEGATT